MRGIPTDILPVNALLAEIKSYGWRFPEAAGEIRWPEIKLSDAEPKPQPNSEPYDMERLGVFTKIFGVLVPCEGHITLYPAAIRKVSDEFVRKNPGLASSEEAFRALATIVLLHEVGHWVVYDVHGRFTETMTPLAVQSEQELWFHEALAQYFTNYAIGHSGLMRLMFNWLLPKQTKPYQVFSNLPELRIDLALIGIEYARQFNTQKFDDLKVLMPGLQENGLTYQGKWFKLSELMMNPGIKDVHLSILKEFIESGQIYADFSLKKRGLIAGRKFGF